jgi:hypothetical protein
MHHHRTPQIESMGKLLAFPVPTRRRGWIEIEDGRAGKLAAASLARKLARSDVWSVRVWLILAWVLAAGRVHLAATQHEVFGLEASLAFVVMVVMPVVRAPNIARVVADGVRALKQQIAGLRRARCRPRTRSVAAAAGRDGC